MSGGCFRSDPGATWRAGKDAQEFIEEFLCADSRIRIVAMNGLAMENLSFECKAYLRAVMGQFEKLTHYHYQRLAIRARIAGL